MSIDITIHGFKDVGILHKVAQHSTSESELLTFLSIWKEFGEDVVSKAIRNPSVVTRGKFRDIIGKEVLTTDGWDIVTNVMPVINGEGWIVTFKSQPDKAYIYDNDGKGKSHAMYLIRNVPKSTKTRKKATSSSEPLTDFES